MRLLCLLTIFCNPFFFVGSADSLWNCTSSEHTFLYVLWKSCNVIPLIQILNDEFKVSLLNLFVTVVFTRLIWLNNFSNVALENYARRQILIINRQWFIQAVLLMSDFERRFSFGMLYSMKNNHKIILQ